MSGRGRLSLGTLGLLVLAACGGTVAGPVPTPTVIFPSATVTTRPTIPVQVSPADGTQIRTFPRDTTLTWRPVDGAVGYMVEVDYCDPTGCAVSATRLILTSVAATSYRFQFVGKQPGRWRVWAVFPSGVEGAKSGWWGFVYLA